VEKEFTAKGGREKSNSVNEGQADNALGKPRWQITSTRDGRLTICQPSMILSSRPQQAKAMPRSVSDGSDRVPAPLLEGLAPVLGGQDRAVWGGGEGGVALDAALRQKVVVDSSRLVGKVRHSPTTRTASGQALRSKRRSGH
jgi:hypothetical protein